MQCNIRSAFCPIFDSLLQIKYWHFSQQAGLKIGFLTRVKKKEQNNLHTHQLYNLYTNDQFYVFTLFCNETRSHNSIFTTTKRATYGWVCCFTEFWLSLWNLVHDLQLHTSVFSHDGTTVETFPTLSKSKDLILTVISPVSINVCSYIFCVLH